MVMRRECFAIAAGAAVGVMGWRSIRNRDDMELLHHPRRFAILPFEDLDRSITADVLEAVTSLLDWRGDMSVPALLHWVRVFGVAGQPQHQPAIARDVVSLLTDSSRLERKYGQSGVIVKTPFGMRYLSGFSNRKLHPDSRAAHPGQELAVFGEIGLPIDASVHCEGREYPLSDFIQSCLQGLQCRESSLQEPEWPTQVIAHYLRSRQWKNRWEESVSVSDWTEFLLERNVASYCCGGTHLLHALALLLQANARESMLAGDVAQRACDACFAYSEVLNSTQGDEGEWLTDWANIAEIEGRGPVAVHMTGHILEGQLYLPPELRIEPTVASAAIRFLSRSFLSAGKEEVTKHYCPYSHAGKVLLMCCRTGR